MLAGLFFVFVLLSLSGCDYLKFVGQKRALKNEFHNHPKMELLRKLNFKKVALLHDQSLYGKSLAEGFYFLSPPNPDHLETPQARAFLERFRKVHAGTPSSVYPLLAFTQSATQIKTTETKAVADYLHRRYFNKSGLAGEIFFNVWEDVVNDLYAVYFVDANGRFILKKQILHGDFI